MLMGGKFVKPQDFAKELHSYMDKKSKERERENKRFS